MTFESWRKRSSLACCARRCLGVNGLLMLALHRVCICCRGSTAAAGQCLASWSQLLSTLRMTLKIQKGYQLVDWKVKRANLTNWEKVQMRRGKMKMKMRWITNPSATSAIKSERSFDSTPSLKASRLSKKCASAPATATESPTYGGHCG